jgi:hypothetical protein
MFGSLLASSDSYAEKPVVKCDMVVVEALERALTTAEKQTLYDWSNLADQKHLHILENIRDKVLQIQPLTEKTYSVYRGMGLNVSFQETMNIIQAGWFGHRLKSGLHLGSTFQFRNARPISFSTDVMIARAFGDIVVTTTVDSTDHFLLFTPELSVVRNRFVKLHNHQTQDEIILFPADRISAIFELHK